MGFFGINFKSKSSNKLPTSPGGDVVERAGMMEGIRKSPIPNFLYKPPFGFPRPENMILIRQFAKNAYVHSVIRMLQTEASSNKWEIKPKEGVLMTPELEEKAKKITQFLLNPNGNKDGWPNIVKMAVRDICTFDSGVWVKVFNRKKEMVELYARDGASFLINPDIYGYIGGRAEIIMPSETMQLESMDETMSKQYFDLNFKNRAAYFQYGFNGNSMPIPYGKREVIYMMDNPRADSVYGVSPIQILADIILTLVFGANYNLDFYNNSNMPEGVLQLIGAQAGELKAFKKRFENPFREKDPVTGFMRKVGFKMPITNRDFKFTTFQLPAREMQILEQQSWFTKIVWMCFGISADDMGFTEDSNKAVSQSQSKKFAKKASRPILQIISGRIDQEIIPEFDTDELQFVWDTFDIDEALKKATLHETQIRMGVKTAEMVAEEWDVNVEELKKQKEENAQNEIEKEKQMIDINNPESEDPKEKEDKEDKNPKKPELKAKDPFANTKLEKELLSQITTNANKVLKALKKQTDGALENVK